MTTKQLNDGRVTQFYLWLSHFRVLLTDIKEKELKPVLPERKQPKQFASIREALESIEQ